ncbi:hypothetical protein LSH36_269g09029 [Paralvinella palmiformis]|uniref:U3 small nucleolar RNA-associated protein 6 homolog C-terminal domain-containing protein n=1 Tax=Paralvinella palmiformis TaxID=53620 RepID=A0AAD9JJN2_9ANNE|nr:hypothetical protein LSH36_269g09029 [Paralvinella palmiformis]
MWSLYIRFLLTELTKKSSRKLCDKSQAVNWVPLGGLLSFRPKAQSTDEDGAFTCATRTRHTVEIVALTRIALCRAALLLMTFQHAADEVKLSAELYSTWVDVLCHVGQVDAVPTAFCHGLGQHPSSVMLWLVRLRFITTTNRVVDEVTAVIEQALNSVEEKESYPLWELALCWAKLHSPDYVDVLLKKGVLKCPEVSVPLKKDYLDWVLFSKDVHSMREIYKSLSGSEPLSIEFFQTYISLEKSQAKPSIKRIKQTYEDAVQHYGSNSVELWLDYIKMEMTHPKGKPQEAGQIHWRAMKTLNGELIEKFVTLYTLLQTGHL